MIRGTTPTHTFTISEEQPFDVSLIADLRISYAQCGKEILVKNLQDVTLDGKTITLKLSQEDTLSFDCGKRVVEIELTVLTTGGDVMKYQTSENVDKCINEDVL